jgi:hypothetical protein
LDTPSSENIESPSKDEQVNSLKKRRYLKWIVVLICIVGGVFGFGFLTEYLVGDVLKGQVEKRSGGQYTINYEKLKFDWSTITVALEGFSYTPLNPVVTSDSINDFTFGAQEVSIQLENLRGIYYEQALHIVRVIIESPDIELTQRKKSKKKITFSIRTGDFYKLIHGFIKSYQIDHFEVNHLEMNYLQDIEGQVYEFKINDLSLAIRNIRIDSAALANNDNLFFTESIDLNIKNQYISIGDELHQMHFDSLNLSTKNNSIEIYNTSVDTANGTLGKWQNHDYNQYDIQIPYTGIKGLNFSKAYIENILNVDSILLSNLHLQAYINWKYHVNQVDSTKHKVDNRAIKILLDVFDEIHLNDFQISNAFLSASYGEGDTASISGLNLDFEKFVLDSTDLSEPVFYPNFGGLKVAIDAPTFDLPGGNLLEANQLSFSTYDSTLKITDVVLKGKKQRVNENTEVRILALEITGVNPEDIFKNKKIELNNVVVLNPELQVINKGNQNEISAFDIADFIHGDFQEYSIQHVQIKNGQVQILTPQNTLSNHKIGRFNIELDEFVLNEESIKKDRFLWSRNARLGLDDVQVYIAKNQHGLSAKKVKINTRTGHLKALDLSVQPIILDSSTIKVLAEINAHEFDIRGIDFHHLKKIKRIDLKQLRVHEVQAKINKIVSDSIESDSSQVFTEFLTSLESIDLNDIDIQDVDVLLQRNGVSVAKFSDGFLNTQKLSASEDKLRNGSLSFLSDSITYGMHRIMIPFTEKRHMLTIEDLERKMDSSLEISGISLRPIPGLRMGDSTIRVISFIPQVIIENFHSFENRYSDTLHVGVVQIDKPMFRITLPKGKKQSNVKFNIPSQLSSTFMNGEIFALGMEQFDIQNGKVTIIQDDTKISVHKLNLNSKDWLISKESEWDPNKFLWANDFSLNLSQLEYKIPEFEDCHHIDSLSYQFRPNSLKIHGIYYNNWKQNEEVKSSQLSLYLPYIDIKNPNVYRYLKESKIEIDQIEARHGIIEADWYRNKNLETKKFSFPTEITSNIKGFDELAIHHLSMNQMDVQMRIHNKNFIAPLEMDHFNIQIDSFHIEPDEQLDTNRVLWANNILVGVQNIYTTVDGGLYELGADAFQFSTQHRNLELRGLSFVPTVGRYEYALHKGVQKDVFNINLKELSVQDLDYFSLLYSKKVRGGILEVVQPSIAILKDKRIPEPPYQFKAVIPEKFKQLPLSITMDSILVDQVRIHYEEFPEKGRNPGSILLTHMDIKATNVSNDTAQLMMDSILRVTMNSRFLDTSDLALYLEYDMLSPINSFKMSSTLGAFDPTLINRYVEPVYSATINSGMVSRMDMSVIGNDSIAGGKMGLYYEDFKFTFLNEVTHENKGFSTKLRNMIGNTIIKTNNKYHPFKRREPLYFERITGKGWINYLLKIELAGVSSSVGLKKYKKELKKANKKLWKEFDQNDKAERKQMAKVDKMRQKQKSKKNN